MAQRNHVHVGVCIYCDSTEGLSKEHSIPYGLAGNIVLGKASCEECRRITSGIETRILRQTMGHLRAVLNLPTRHPENRPDAVPLVFIRGDIRSEEQVPLGDAIPALVLPELGPPAVLRGLRHGQGLEPGAFIAKVHLVEERRTDENVQRILTKYNADAIEIPFEIKHDDFLRFIAKIALCKAVFAYGYYNFERIYIKSAILGRDLPEHWVGSDGHYSIYLDGGFDDSAHVSATMRPKGGREVWVRVKLWNKSLTPEYIVVVGRLRSGYSEFLDLHNLIA